MKNSLVPLHRLPSTYLIDLSTSGLCVFVQSGGTDVLFRQRVIIGVFHQTYTITICGQPLPFATESVNIKSLIPVEYFPAKLKEWNSISQKLNQNKYSGKLFLNNDIE